MKTQNPAKEKEVKGIITLLGESWRLYRANMGILIGYSAWILLPYAAFLLLNAFIPDQALLQAYFSSDLSNGETSLPILILVISLLVLQGIITIWASNAITLSVSVLSQEKKPDTEKINSRSWAVIIPLLWVAILTTLAILGGLILLIIPGIIFAVWFCFSQISVVLDDKRGLQALHFSRTLVSGRFFEILRRIVLGPFVILMIYLLIASLLIGLTISIGSVFSGNVEEIVRPISIIADVIETVLEVLFLPLFLSYATLLYLDVKRTGT